MKYHPLLKEKLYSWKQLEEKIENLPTTKEMGDAFEQFAYGYLLLRSALYQIDELYMFDDIPHNYRVTYGLEQRDCGVDGLMILKDGKSAAFQAKFRSNREKPSYAELTKFWVEAKNADYNYTIANCYALSPLCSKQPKHLSILVDVFDALNSEFFDEFFHVANELPARRHLYHADPYQKRMINSTMKGFAESDKGKLIAACGTGKTLTALWICERMQANKVLFLAPSLALIKQTLTAWAGQSKMSFSYICVCSDKTVADDIDSGDIKSWDMGVPVTTSPDMIARFVSSDVKNRQVVFSTYQSLDSLSAAVEILPDFMFDLIVFDEAHRTAGAKSSSLFSLALHNENIPARKRLFMTATERLVRPQVVKKAIEHNRIVFSMDDPKLYGSVFVRFSFGKAISAKIIADYRIVVAGVKAQDVYQWIAENRLLVQTDKDSHEYHTCAQNVFRQTMLVKAMQELSVKKCITFHSTIKGAQVFIDGSGSGGLSLSRIFAILWPNFAQQNLHLSHVSGQMSAGKRKMHLDSFKNSELGIISNARCLTEGVDVPLIDSIYFVNPKHSLIDIVQACGRALRKPRDKHDKLAYFIVPILIPDCDDKASTINEIDFEALFNLIQSLRDQDQRLAEWIDRINLTASRGKVERFSKDRESPIMLNLPVEFDVKDFERKLYLKIAEVNSEPTNVRYKVAEKYGKSMRKSHHRRIFKTLGDYTVRSYRENLILPTLNRFSSEGQMLTSKELRIDHNNISHTERLGLIAKIRTGYKLSPLGTQLYNKKISFEDAFRRQMLRYFSLVDDAFRERILFPYRGCLKILLKTKTLNFIEFVFGPYLLADSSSISVTDAVADISYLRINYPKLAILSSVNKRKVLEELNEHFRTNFSQTDVWAKRTTIYNQFGYFRDHLALFEGIVTVDSTSGAIGLTKGAEKALVEMLQKDESLECERNTKVLTKSYLSALIIFMLVAL